MQQFDRLTYVSVHIYTCACGICNVGRDDGDSDNVTGLGFLGVSADTERGNHDNIAERGARLAVVMVQACWVCCTWPAVAIASLDVEASRGLHRRQQPMAAAWPGNDGREHRQRGVVRDLRG
ncbi:hypothetical protein PVAP13_5KG425507 [Panicum virgatum]|uniref:Uncharacterized protein n=1 Tax=Panicum virgatum TaxID=38727 RepID=A0A8T0SLW5_PANVG|nr:hypothetical protein PVAP13_5KG425507 [Panicum virgatum]